MAPGDPVLLWVDTWTNAFSPEVGQAAVEVLEAAGCSVRIPDRQVCCGLTWISTGQLDGARRQLRRSLDALAPALADGLPVVGLEPSCTAVLRSDAAELLPDDERAAQLSGPTRTLAELLTERGWQPPSLAGVEAVAQPHCHQHAVLGFAADSTLLTGAGAQLQTVGGCCGLAGNFGVERGHYEVSVAVAEQALLPAVRGAGPDTVLLADGFSCRTQLDQLSRPHRPAPGAAAGRAGCPRSDVRHPDPRDLFESCKDPAMTAGFVPPPYPYERLGEIKAIADRHAGGAIDLSIGTPCDPPPAAVIAALAEPGRAEGYPPSIGTPELRTAAADWMARRLGAKVDPEAEVAACVGTKEFVASVPQHLKLRTPAGTPCCTRRSATRRMRWARSWPACARCLPAAGRDRRRRRRAGAVRLGELAEQPDRRAARPGGGGRLGPRPETCRCSRTSATPSSATPAGRHHPHQRHRRGAGAALAVQAGQLRRRPDRLLRRRRRAGALPARGAQARRADAARPGAARGGGRAGRRRARRGAARAVLAPDAAAVPGAGCGGVAR